MREHFAIFYFMFPVLIPTLIALGWGITMSIRAQLASCKTLRGDV